MPGLSSAEVVDRRARDGPNEVPPPPLPSLGARIGRELRSPLSALLVVAGIVSFVALRETAEGSAILAIVALNTLVAVAQERRADAAVDALRELTAPHARVWRDGHLVDVAARELVAEDVVELTAGDRVPADGCLDEALSLAVDEQVVTGESMPVDKKPGNDVLAGTLVVRGRGVARVTATGARSTVGRLASGLGEAPPAPLALELRRTAARMTIIAVALATVLVPVAWARGEGDEHALGDALLFGVALAVAAIPEGLLAVVTLALSLGAQRMARRGTIVRRLPAIEALGAASVLCFDKTGTLTTGRLRVAEVVSVDGREDALWAAVLRCNDAEGSHGDPLDVAIAEEAGRRRIPRPAGARVSEQPFDTALRLMATVHGDDCGRPVLSVKGAPETVLARCAAGDDVDRLRVAVDRLAAQGRRVIAVADAPEADLDARPLRALGLVAFEDPLRSTAAPAVAALREAGVRLVLVTGDHAATAASTAEAVGLDAAPLITGEMLASGSRTALADAAVVARVDPSVKVDLVRAHRAAGRIVAMSGDGVNDAPALRQADVGVAVLGGAGTDVAREAAAVVVTDADLSMIVEAVREGRRIYRNLVSVVGYLLSGNLSEIAVIVVAMVTFPDIATVLLPVQLLWVNLVTDGIPALALAVDVPPDDPLKGPPRSPGVPLLHRRRLLELIGRGAVAAAAVVGVTVISGSTGEGAIRAQMVTALVFCHLVLAYVARHEVATFARGWWRNRLLLAAVGASALLQVGAFVIAPLRRALALDALPPAGWLYAVGAAVATVVVIDAGRLLTRLGRT